MALVAGSYCRFAIGVQPPPGQDINANAAMVITAVTQTDRGGILTCSRQGKYVGQFPAASMVEVRAPA